MTRCSLARTRNRKPAVPVDINIGYRAHGRVSGNDSLETSETATDTLHRRESGHLALWVGGIGDGDGRYRIS
jgi:hypothetical protein